MREAGFTQQTLRQFVRTSVGGSVARVRVSNAFGTQPLVIADAHIALPDQSRAGAINPDGARRITFGGQTSVAVPVGATMLSDPVAFPVPALSDVVVDLYLPKETSPAALHNAGLRTTYIVQGNAAGKESLPAAQLVQSHFFLTNLDLQDASLSGAVVALGASITNGSASTLNGNRRWTDRLASRLAAAGLHVGVLNMGISGNRLLIDGAGLSAKSRFERDVLSQPGVRWVIFSDNPINDLGFAASQDTSVVAPSAEALIAALAELIKLAHGREIKFFCSTLTPYGGASYWTPRGEAVREQFNIFVRAPGNGCDGFVDQDAATHDAADPMRFLPAYDSGDHLHPNDAGHAAIAAAIDLALFSLTSNRAQ